MGESRRRRQLVPLALGAAMMAVVIAAALAPLAAPVPAQSECPYGVCPNTSTGLPVWVYGAILGVLAVTAIAIAFVLLRRRRRPSPPSGAEPAETGGFGPSPPYGAAGVAGPEYLETPEDYGTPPPAVPAAPPVAPPEEGTEADIDSLMRELDKISTEILKKSEPGKAEGAKRPPPPTEDEDR